MQAPPPTPSALPSRLPASVRRALRVDAYSRAQSGVWYYQVDIELRCDDDVVQSYSVRRRYTEFAQLYDKIKEQLVAGASEPAHAVGDSGLPTFPQKELISSSVLGMLWRVAAPKRVLEERRAKFEALLRWVERHPTMRESSAFLDFLGQPPQVSEGYVSLKEYTAQNWLSTLEKLTKEKEKRRRRLSSDCSTAPPRPTRKRRQAPADAVEVAVGSSKRLRRMPETQPCQQPTACSTLRKHKRTRSLSSSEAKAALLSSSGGDAVAQVESSRNRKRNKIQ